MKKKQIKIKRTDDQCRIEILKTELHYYKGLAIVVVALTLCVFIAFAALFTAMYLETRATRLIIEKAFSDFIPEVEIQPLTNEEPALTEQSVETEPAETPAEQESAVKPIEWLSFAKYGVTVYFPNSWTFLDKPYKKELHFFSNGKVREIDSDDIGDLSVAFTKIDSSRDEYQGTLTDIDGRVGFTYKFKTGAIDRWVAAVPFGKNYIEFRFREKISGKENLSLELIKAMIGKIELQ
jgi:hypothetical protein